MTLAVPIIFANFLQTAYQITDTFWVGRLGTAAVASVSISFPIVFLLVSFGGGLVTAGAVLVAQYKGAENSKAVDHIVSQTMLLVLVVSTVIAVIGYFSSPFLIKLMGANSEVFSGAVSYLKVSFIGMVCLFIYRVFQSLMRGVGKVKAPAFIVLGTVFLNLILDPLFIFGYGFIPAYGITGAAISTVLTEGIACIIGIVLLLKGTYQIKLHLNDLTPDTHLLKKMFKIGFPASIEQSARAFGMIVMTFLVASFGTVALAAYGIGGRILGFVIIPALGLSVSTSTLVGQNIGAKKIWRAEKTAWLGAYIGFFALTFVGIILFIFASQISTFFVPGETETIKMSALFIKIMSLSFGFIGIQMAFNGAFRASGNTVTSMMLSLLSLWLLRFPLAFFLSKYTHMAEMGIWFAFPVANVVSAFVVVTWFMSGTWKTKKLTQEIRLKKETTKETIIESQMNN